MVIIEGLPFSDCDAGIERSCEKFVRIADSCERQNAAAFQCGNAVGIGNEAAVSPAGDGVGVMTVSPSGPVTVAL